MHAMFADNLGGESVILCNAEATRAAVGEALEALTTRAAEARWSSRVERAIRKRKVSRRAPIFNR
jgi:hypothetical protein